MLARCAVPSREGIRPLLSAQKAGADVHSSLVTFVLSVWLETALDPPTGLCHKLIFVNLKNPSLWKVPHVIYKEFCCSHVRALFSLLCSLKRFMCALLCTQIEVIITRISFHPIVLCLNMPKINDSEVRLP